MANNDFIKKSIRHPLAIGIIASVIAAVIQAGLEQSLDSWPQILGSGWRWVLQVISDIPTWIWYVGGLVCTFLLGGTVSVFILALLIRRRQQPGRQRHLSNLTGITTPIVRLDGILIDGYVEFNRLGEQYQFDNPNMAAELFEVVVEADSPSVQVLKCLIPPRDAYGQRSVGSMLRCTVHDETGHFGYIFDGACLDSRGYQSAHIGFIFALGLERVV